MGWDGFMEMERTKLRERSQGRLRRALGMPLPGESKEQLDQIGEDDQRRAEQGLVSIKGEHGRISYKHIDDLSPLEMRFITAAEWVRVALSAVRACFGLLCDVHSRIVLVDGVWAGTWPVGALRAKSVGRPASHDSLSISDTSGLSHEAHAPGSWAPQILG
jgi:hypothetical protein